MPELSGQYIAIGSRAKKAALLAARNKQEEDYIRTVVYAGFHPTRLQDSGEHSDSLFFRAEEFLRLLRRCRLLGVNVVFMFHESTDDELCMSSGTFRGDQAEAVFRAWRDKGCNEWFCASIGVPDKVLDGLPEHQE